LDRDYKIKRSIEHRAKFRADRPTELGDYVRKKKELEIWGKRTKDRTRQSHLDFVAIFISSRDICGQARKLS